MLTEENNVQQTVSEISSLCKNDDNKVHYGEMEPEKRAEKSAPEGGLWPLTLRNGWFDGSLRMTP